MFNITYLPHVLYSFAITTLSIHLIGQKHEIADERTRIAARLSTLESVAGQLRDRKVISQEELDRLRQLAFPTLTPSAERAPPIKEQIRWKEAIFGRKGSSEHDEMNEYERRDWEKVKKDIEKEE